MLNNFVKIKLQLKEFWGLKIDTIKLVKYPKLRLLIKNKT